MVETMRAARSLFCPAVALLAVACGSSEPPVGHVDVAPSEIRLVYSGFSEYQLTWQPETPLDGVVGDLRAKVHLKGDDGKVLRTFDHSLDFDWSVGSSRPTRQVLYQSALAPALGEGEYELDIGLYDEGGNRWAVTSSSPVVRVEDASEGFPAFYFSPEWLPIEGGTDLQILGRRWLKADGLIRLGELTAPGALWLQIGVPEARDGELEMLFEDGATAPEVVVSSSCGVPSQTLRGSGPHHVLLEVRAGDEGVLPEECELAIDANYTLIAIESQVRRTVALESLCWLTGDAPTWPLRE